MLKPLLLAGAASCLLAGAAQAAGYPQVPGPNGTYVPPQPVAATGVLADGATPCVLPSSGCQAASSAASGLAPVAGAITSAARGASFIPIAGRVFHLQLTGTAVATCYVVRQLDATNWAPVTINGTAFYGLNYSGAAMSEDLIEAQAGVAYALDCGAALGGYVSGAVSYRWSQ